MAAMQAEHAVVIKHLEEHGKVPAGLLGQAIAAGLDWTTLISVIVNLPWAQMIKWLQDFINGLKPTPPTPAPAP